MTHNKPPTGPASNGEFFRLSLPALNVVRGRDHGIPPYNEYRRACGLSVAYSFEDLAGEIRPEDIANLANTYDHVGDIDLWTGGLLELPLYGGVVGPTFACILGKQFQALKFGDRFYYENGQDEATRLTLPQLNSIRDILLARIMCDNTDITYIQPDVFRMPLPGYNPMLQCSELRSINFDLWREAGTDIEPN